MLKDNEGHELTEEEVTELFTPTDRPKPHPPIKLAPTVKNPRPAYRTETPGFGAHERKVTP